MAHVVGRWKLSSGSRYTESQTLLYQMLVVFDRRNDVVCYAYSLSLLYKLDLNNYTLHKNASRIFSAIRYSKDLHALAISRPKSVRCGPAALYKSRTTSSQSQKRVTLDVL